MDEDDAIAILTRRLITEHEFFIWKGKADTSPRLKTKGKNVRSGDPFFTTLQTLYGMNETLLRTPMRNAHNFADKNYKQYRPSEDELDKLFDELIMYWSALLSEVSFLSEDPTKMREHDAMPHNSDGVMDNLLFWPIGQELFAKVTRSLLNRRLPDPEAPTIDDVRSVVRTLADRSWDLHQPPWRGLLLIQNPESNAWRMRSEDRKQALEVGERMLRWQVGLDDLPDADQEELKVDWHVLLIPRPTREELEADWRCL